MVHNKAYRDAEEKIEEAIRSNATSIKLSNFNDDNPKLLELPESLMELTTLKVLDVSYNRLTSLPDWLRRLDQLQSINLGNNQISFIPDWIDQFSNLETLTVFNNKIKELPESFRKLTRLLHLNLSQNYLTKLPDWFGDLINLKSLDIAGNQLTNLPETFCNLAQLGSLHLDNNRLKLLPEKLGKISKLWSLNLSNNNLIDLPYTFIDLENFDDLIYHSKTVEHNPLNPELSEAYRQGLDAVRTYLRAKAAAQTIIHEAKLILVGEGEVGKSCLLDSLLDKPFQQHDSTHGIEIQSFSVKTNSQDDITINAWDFGGQRVYRPTHQLFFSAPAVYLVVWKPREGSQAGHVKEWIQLIKRREPTAKILVVATHGGPQQRQPDIDRQEIWDLFSKDTVVYFFFVDSKPDAQDNRRGIKELKQAIAEVAVQLPEVGRSVPKSFADVRQALQDKGMPYLPLREVLAICRAHKMDDEIAKLFITISHRLGHLTHYENDPTLRDIVILRPDWLATAMSYVLDDEDTRTKHGMVNFARLKKLWDDPTRSIENRYPEELHPIFLRLMERFDLSYRVKDPYARDESDPISLIGQLVPDVRPSNLLEAWGESPSVGDIQQTQICRIVDAGNGQSANAEGLFYQLIVRLHKYSLGRADYKASVHWQRGLVLEDEFKNRALLEHVGNDVRITVRSPFPEGLLGMLTREVKYLVESFWEGLRCDIMVPCLSPCGKTPGTGMFEVEKLMVFKKQGMTMFPCMVSGCNQAQNIDLLLRNAPAASQAISIAELQSEFTAIKDKLDDVNVTSRRILSQVDKTYTDLLQVLTDEAKEGPRLFSFFPIDRSNFNPKEWIRAKFRLVLWCEHSRLPLPALNGADSTNGVYDLELDREWFKKSAPYLKFLTGTLGMVLPVASSSVKLALDEAAYKLIEEQLDFGKSVIDAAIGTSGNVNDFMSKADVTDLEHGVAARADGSTLRELHALLKSKDPGFGGLVRVMNKRQEFLWVHERFAGEY